MSHDRLRWSELFSKLVEWDIESSNEERSYTKYILG